MRPSSRASPSTESGPNHLRQLRARIGRARYFEPKGLARGYKEDDALTAAISDSRELRRVEWGGGLSKTPQVCQNRLR